MFSCNKDRTSVHWQNGVWKIERIEIYSTDNTTGDFILERSSNDAGYICLYDQGYYGADGVNDCYYHLDSNVTSISLTDGPSDEYVLWFCDVPERITLGSLVYYVEKENANQQKWTYFSYTDYLLGPTIYSPYKEILHLKRP